MDFIVTAKRENQDDVITHVRAKKVEGNEVVSTETKERREVIDDIGYDDEEGLIYFTALKNNGDWEPRERIRVVDGDTGDYIRSDPNDIEEDNLDELPDF